MIWDVRLLVSGFPVIIVTSMKHTQLSNFQKQQYTAYLETQLQKFSAFMLSQKKQNQKGQELEEVLARHSDLIQQLQDKAQVADLYQRQILTNQQKLFKKCEQQQDLDIRLRRLEDRDRFDCDKSAREQRDGEARDRSSESNYLTINRRLKMVEEKIVKLKDGQSQKLANFPESEVSSMIEEHTLHRMKKAEKKMKKYFATKFQDIQCLLKKPKKHRSKSPAARSPIEMSTATHYEVEPLSHFRLADHSTYKNELSTILRDSNNTTISNRHKGDDKPNIHKKKTKKQKKDESKSQSRSKSRSQRKDKGKNPKKSKKGAHSRSKSRDVSYSPNFSDISMLRSSVSRSKSNISQDKNRTKQGNKKENRNKRSVSRSKSLSRSQGKSNHSSISVSLNQKCRGRPCCEQIPAKRSKGKAIAAKAHKGRS